MYAINDNSSSILILVGTYNHYFFTGNIRIW